MTCHPDPLAILAPTRKPISADFMKSLKPIDTSPDTSDHSDIFDMLEASDCSDPPAESDPGVWPQLSPRGQVEIDDTLHSTIVGPLISASTVSQRKLEGADASSRQLNNDYAGHTGPPTSIPLCLSIDSACPADEDTPTLIGDETDDVGDKPWCTSSFLDGFMADYPHGPAPQANAVSASKMARSAEDADEREVAVTEFVTIPPSSLLKKASTTSKSAQSASETHTSHHHREQTATDAGNGTAQAQNRQEKDARIKSTPFPSPPAGAPPKSPKAVGPQNGPFLCYGYSGGPIRYALGTPGSLCPSPTKGGRGRTPDKDDRYAGSPRTAPNPFCRRSRSRGRSISSSPRRGGDYRSPSLHGMREYSQTPIVPPVQLPGHMAMSIYCTTQITADKARKKTQGFGFAGRPDAVFLTGNSEPGTASVATQPGSEGGSGATAPRLHPSNIPRLSPHGQPAHGESQATIAPEATHSALSDTTHPDRSHLDDTSKKSQGLNVTTRSKVKKVPAVIITTDASPAPRAEVSPSNPFYNAKASGRRSRQVKPTVTNNGKRQRPSVESDDEGSVKQGAKRAKASPRMGCPREETSNRNGASGQHKARARGNNGVNQGQSSSTSLILLDTPPATEGAASPHYPSCPQAPATSGAAEPPTATFTFTYPAVDAYTAISVAMSHMALHTRPLDDQQARSQARCRIQTHDRLTPQGQARFIDAFQDAGYARTYNEIKDGKTAEEWLKKQVYDRWAGEQGLTWKR